MDEEGKKKNDLISWLVTILIGLIIVYICREFLFFPLVVNGASMTPTYENGDIIIVSKISDIDRFDQIVFQSPIEDEFYIKRVIGLQGDSIEMKEDVLIINGKEYLEPYVNRETTDPFQKRITENFSLEEITGEEKVPKGYLFVLGDNRLKSTDSRHYGLIAVDEVIGESKMRIYPFKHIRLFMEGEDEE